MVVDYDDCRANLGELVGYYHGSVANRNEATTRLQLIDDLFFKCLGWSKRIDLQVEEPFGGEYADYVFSSSRRLLIVEAKKEGMYFEVPAGKERLEYSIPSLLRDSPALKAALDQAAGYCQTRGVPFGVVSNGHQLVVFVGTRNDGVPPLEGRALVFPSLEFMLEHFMDLWQALSKPGIEQKSLQARLLGDLIPELPPKPCTTVQSYPGVKDRNPLQVDMQILSDLIFEDLIGSRDLEPQFLEECYSQSGALSQYSLMSKSILQARYAALFDSEGPRPTAVPATNRNQVSPDILAQTLSRRPIILIGDVGAGKTTFLRKLIRVDAAALFENAITLYLDLGSQATLTMDLRAFVVEEVARQLREDHDIDIQERDFIRGVYHADLQRFNKGLYAPLREENLGLFREKEIQFLEEKLSNNEQHLKHSLEHVSKGRKKQIVVFLDNADQRDEDTQQAAFLIAQEIAEHWPTTVFVTLRPETFHRSARVGALSGYLPKVFTISPPRIDRVIEKRLEFALKLTSGELPIQALAANVGVDLDKLEAIINVFLDSLKCNRDLREFIDNIAAGNVRLALNLVQGFFGSGHVDTQKIANIYYKSGSYTIPLHEFVRAVMYGDAEYYDPESSPIANLFDVSQADPKEHFLLPALLALLSATESAQAEDGFVETARVYEHLQGLGYTPEQIDQAIVRGHRGKLIETAARRIPSPGQTMPQTLRATSVGIYHVSKLCRLFTYVDAVLIDTPIFDADIREDLRNFRSLDARLGNVEILRQYFDAQWKKVDSSRALFNWASVSADISSDIDRIRDAVDQAAARGRTIG